MKVCSQNGPRCSRNEDSLQKVKLCVFQARRIIVDLLEERTSPNLSRNTWSLACAEVTAGNIPQPRLRRSHRFYSLSKKFGMVPNGWWCEANVVLSLFILFNTGEYTYKFIHTLLHYCK